MAHMSPLSRKLSPKETVKSRLSCDKACPRHKIQSTFFEKGQALLLQRDYREQEWLGDFFTNLFICQSIHPSIHPSIFG
jgi:hypothetical protein